MTVLPIADRELRVAARAPRTYWSRAGVALGAIALVIFVYAAYETVVGSRVGGQHLFSALGYLSLAYALFAGTSLTADCLSREKREETLGFLFLTDLKGYDVVLGKLVATSVRSIYGLLATFPILSLPVLLGGVRAAEFWRVIVVVLNTLLLSLSVGLLISTIYRRQRVTTHLASLIMLLLAVLPAGVSAVLRSATGLPRFWFDPAVLSPLYSLYSAFDNGYRLASVLGPSFGAALITQFGLALLLLLRASWLLPRSWQQGAARTRLVAEVLTRPISIETPKIVNRRRVLDRNPIYWLSARGWGTTLGLFGLILFVGAWAFDVRDDREEFAAAQGVGLLLVALVYRMLIVVVAAQRLAEDKQSGALDLIITTPIAVATILEGQWQAIWRKLASPFIASLVLYAFLIFGRGSSDNESALLFTALCFLGLTVADSIALGWLGMWTGLNVRHVPHGAATCLGKVVLPPALIAGAFVCNFGLTSADEYIKTNPYLIPALWLFFGLLTDWGWTVWARNKLFTEFRLAATERLPRAKRT